VPLYDHERRRLFFVDAQPGGNGLAQWLYQHAEEVLQVAYDVALACRADPLLEPLSRVEQDWLLALLGRTPAEPLRHGEPSPTVPPPASRIDRRQSSESPTTHPDRRQPFVSPETPTAPRGDPAQPSREERASRQHEAPSAPETMDQSKPTGVQNDERGDTPDAAALIERLRRQREQRERAKDRGASAAPARETNVPLRFAAGDRIFCLPYGDGEVLESRIEDGREVLTVRFPDYGELTIDPALSLVRKLEPPPED
ncbi:MAG: DUF1998 domain-containing protein, partial [Roseiflexaceae bacterium]|nr:DUF1998 domain-containing protein [Roseiflexaceae bacterium]